MNMGWIKLHRKIIDSWVYDNPQYFKIWNTFLLTANHSTNKVLHDRKLITIKRGDFISSLPKLSDKMGIGIQVIRDFIELAVKDKMIIKHHNTKKTHITICNYNSYQGSDADDNTKKTRRKHDYNNKQECINNDNENTTQTPVKADTKKSIYPQEVINRFKEEYSKLYSIITASNPIAADVNNKKHIDKILTALEDSFGIDDLSTQIEEFFSFIIISDSYWVEIFKQKISLYELQSTALLNNLIIAYNTAKQKMGEN